MTKRAKILLVPCPITPVVAYAFFVYRQLGILGTDVFVRYHTSRCRFDRPQSFGHGLVMSLSAPDSGIVSHLLELIARRVNEPFILKRNLTYCYSGDSVLKNNFRLNRWLIGLSARLKHPIDVLTLAEKFFARCFEQVIDLWTYTDNLQLDELPVQSYFFDSLPTDRCFINFPVFKASESVWTKSASWIEKIRRAFIITRKILEGRLGRKDLLTRQTSRHLFEGRAITLQDYPIILAISGESGSGKSTLAASLAAEMSIKLRGLKTRQGWSLLNLKIVPLTSDLATPVLDEIMAGRGQNRRFLRSLKRPWTLDLAVESLTNLMSISGPGKIIITDLPGRMTPITEIMASRADAGIIATRKWENISDWRRFMRDLGVPVIGEFKTQTRQGSVITEWKPGESVSGRIVRFDRMVRSWDRAVEWMAMIFLFDILPGLIVQRQEKLELAARKFERRLLE